MDRSDGLQVTDFVQRWGAMRLRFDRFAAPDGANVVYIALR